MWVVMLGILVVVGLGLVFVYNRIVSQRNRVDEAWAQISVQLKRRHDLIPNLVATVKGYAGHEQQTLEDVISARSAAVGAQRGASGGPTAAEMQAEGQLSMALGRLLAISESYPDLKATENFQQLQAELVATEDRIAFSRQYYNDVTRQWNTTIASIPYNLIAGPMAATRRPYFELNEMTGGPGAAPGGGATQPPDVTF